MTIKYHHYWPLIAQMPPLKHSLTSTSEVIEWLKSQFKIDYQLANAVFNSAKQARYVVKNEGLWMGDARGGYEFWKYPDKNLDKKKKPLRSHGEMLQITEYVIMLEAVLPIMDQKQRILTTAEAREVIFKLWPEDPLSKARRRLAMQLYRNCIELGHIAY